MKELKINHNKTTYNLDGKSFFETFEGEKYSLDVPNTFELLTLLLEAIGMDISERDDLLDKLETKHELYA